MKLISCHQGRLLTLSQGEQIGGSGEPFRTGLDVWDELAPGGAFARGAIHELLTPRRDANPLLAATLLARAALGLPCNKKQPVVPSPGSGGILIWSDPKQEIYPPALAQRGIPIQRLYLLRCSPAEQCWAITESLRCKGVSAVVAAMTRLTRVEARRLQLAAERGGGAGILLRPAGNGDKIYAAATRWLVRPAPGERTIHRWKVQLLHGPGGKIGQSFILEYWRNEQETRAVKIASERATVETAYAS